MAVRRRKRTDGTYAYQVRLRDAYNQGRWLSKTFRTRKDAERWERDVLTKFDSGLSVDPRGGKVRFGDYAADYLQNKNNVAVSTRANIEGRIKSHLGSFADRPLDSIRANDVEAWQREMKAKGLAPATINDCHGTLTQVLRRAVRDGLLPRNVAEDVSKLPMAERRDIRPATPEAIHELADNIDPRYRAAILFVAFGSGVRPGELWALRVNRIDFFGRKVEIVESVDDRTGRFETGPTKTRRGRWVSLDKATLDTLAAHIKAYGCEEGFLFSTAEGKQVSHRNFTRDGDPRRDRGPGPFRRAVAATESLPPGFRFYDLRHTHASLLFAQGARPDQVKQRLGHGSIRTTVDWYAHLLPGHDSELLSGLADLQTSTGQKVALDATG